MFLIFRIPLMRGQDWLTKRWTGGDQEWGFEFRQNYLRFPVAWHARRNNKKAERPPLCPPGINWLKCVSNIQGSSSDQLRGKGRAWPPPVWLRLLPLIAQRPALVRSTRLVAYCSDPSPVTPGNRSRGARPFKAKLHLICLNNSFFDFKIITYILILIVLN